MKGVFEVCFPNLDEVFIHLSSSVLSVYYAFEVKWDFASLCYGNLRVCKHSPDSYEIVILLLLLSRVYKLSEAILI